MSDPLPFDRVRMGTDFVSVDEFLALPLYARIELVLDGTLAFFREDQRVDRGEALAALASRNLPDN